MDALSINICKVASWINRNTETVEVVEFNCGGTFVEYFIVHADGTRAQIYVTAALIVVNEY